MRATLSRASIVPASLAVMPLMGMTWHGAPFEVDTPEQADGFKVILRRAIVLLTLTRHSSGRPPKSQSASLGTSLLSHSKSCVFPKGLAKVLERKAASSSASMLCMSSSVVGTTSGHSCIRSLWQALPR